MTKEPLTTERIEVIRASFAKRIGAPLTISDEELQRIFAENDEIKAFAMLRNAQEAFLLRQDMGVGTAEDVQPKTYRIAKTKSVRDNILFNYRFAYKAKFSEESTISDDDLEDMIFNAQTCDSSAEQDAYVLDLMHEKMCFKQEDRQVSETFPLHKNVFLDEKLTPVLAPSRIFYHFRDRTGEIHDSTSLVLSVCADYRQLFRQTYKDEYKGTDHSIFQIISRFYPNGGEVDNNTILGAMSDAMGEAGPYIPNKSEDAIVLPHESKLSLAEALTHDEMPTDFASFVLAYIAFAEEGASRANDKSLALAKTIMRAYDLTGDDIEAFEAMIHAIWDQV